MNEVVTGRVQVIKDQSIKDKLPTLTVLPAPGVRYPVLNRGQLLQEKPADLQIVEPGSLDFPTDVGGEIELVFQQTGINPDLKQQYHYDSKGRLVEKRQYLSNEGHFNRNVYLYDEHGRLVEERWYRRNPELAEPKEPVLQITKTYDYDLNKPDYLYKKTQIVRPQN